MKYSQARPGRVFVMRLEDGDVLHETIENFARRENVSAASLILVGGADKGSILISGPKHGRRKPVTPMEFVLKNVHEITGTGTIFPDREGNPVLHLHIACGRGRRTQTGCVRRGVKTWHVMEAVLYELTDTNARRLFDPETGFDLLTV